MEKKSKNSPVYVTQPHLPPLEEFIPYLKTIWRNKILTNIGPFHQQLEEELCAYLGVNHISLFTNGTIALVTALQSLKITGEVITTPYSFVATSHSLLWNGIKPVFVDIDPNSFNIDPSKIEAAITPRTTAILAVHCYGYPCDVHAVQRIADRYNLKVIYDAAHAFGVRYQSGSLLGYGDLSILSLHATKVFNTFEGGAIICPDLKTKIRIDQLKNFGYAGETKVVATGINGKMSEFNAALGLLQLKHIDNAITRRKEIDRLYRSRLKDVKGIRCISSSHEISSNFAYFPILIENDYPMSRDTLYSAMKEIEVHPRRYFYPLISEFPMYRELSSAHPNNLPTAMKIASQVLCLPIYPDLPTGVVDDICRFIVERTSAEIKNEDIFCNSRLSQSRFNFSNLRKNSDDV